MKPKYGSPVGPVERSLPLPAPAWVGSASPAALEPDQSRRLATLRGDFPFMPGIADDVALLIPTQVPVGALLSRLVASEPEPRVDLQGSINLEGGSAGRLGRFVEIGPWFFKTSLDRAFADMGEATDREQERERFRRRLRIYPPERLWFLCHGQDRKIWACSLTPRLLTLRELFNQTGGDRQCWRLFLRALAWTLEILERWNVILDCNPNNFGVAQDRLYYLDDDLMPECGHVAWMTQALLRLREYPEANPRHRRRFVLGLLDLVQRYDRRSLDRWGLAEDLDNPRLWPVEPELSGMLSDLLLRLRYTRKR